MAEPDIREFVHERFNRVDQKLDKVLEVLFNVRDRVGILEQQYANLSRRGGHEIDALFDALKAVVDVIQTLERKCTRAPQF